ncbi:GumC family protein [Mangrovibacterium diazotrophicum]|uniref:Capsular exopolysaccharide synthesis family protein n=1 Tax=Mangrovibacterium diazotrophicum TaxID=1261403 RepID=A0A419VXB7_9BACT|nr:polysaccharide biosynthesis tyrosine autokinase [Mangrovibacterium diazotrophicum]RKD87730.1 capsular exopolysaccharide synthesis family protein [Mangrovibacterium diazotrophicum]
MDRKEELLKLLLQKEEQPQNIKDFLFKLLYHWKWFVLTVVVGVGIAFVFNRYTPATYRVKSLLFIKDKESSGVDLQNIFSSSPLKSDVKLSNHIEILKSFSLNYEVLENLGWNVSWYRHMPLGDFILYGNEPCHVEFEPDAFNLKGVPVHISPINDREFKIEVKSKANLLGINTEVDFEGTGVFGEKFENRYFSFTLQKKVLPTEGDYYFEFNDLEKLTLSYLRQLQVSTVNKDADVISLQLTGQNPDQKISYLNELSRVYIQYGLQQKNQISDNTIHFINQQLKDIVDTLKSTSNEFTKYRSSNKVFDLSQEATLVTGKLSNLDTKRSMAEMQLEYYKNLRGYIGEDGNMKNIVFPSVVGITDVGLNSMVVRLSELNSKKETLSYSVHSKNPGIQVIDKELEYVKKSLVENLDNLIFNTENELKSIKQDIEEVDKQLEAYPKTEQDLINIKRMVDLNNELYNFLLQKRAESQITKASNVPDVDVLDVARRATTEQIGPKKKVNLMIGLFLGLAVPFLFIVVRNFLEDGIQDREQVQKLTELPVIADVMHNTYNEYLPVVNYPRSVLAESLRELRTSLDYLSFGRNGGIIGIHSLIPGEGKSFIASNLAVMLAMNNQKVVLIDADLRKPTLHHCFDLTKDVGLSTYLIGRHTREQIVQPVSIKNLSVITSGLIPPNPVELLGSDEFDTLLKELGEQFDVIVIDNSPVTLVTDAAVVSRHTQCNLFVVRQKRSPKKMVQLLSQIVAKNKMQKTGIVLNDVDPKRYGNYAYRYGGYYHKAYYGESGNYFDDKSKAEM